MQNAGLDKAQIGIKIAGRNINNLRYSDDTTFMTKSKEELKSLLMNVKKEIEKAGLKVQHSKTEDPSIWAHHFMARWRNNENCERLYFLGFQNHCMW